MPPQPLITRVYHALSSAIAFLTSRRILGKVMRFALNITALCAAALVAYAQALDSGLKSLLFGAVLTSYLWPTMAQYLNYLSDSRQRKAFVEGMESHVAVMFEQLGDLHKLPRSQRNQIKSAKDLFIAFVLFHAARMVGPEGTRANLYRREVLGGTERLTYVQSAGRGPSKAKAKFRAGTPAGDAALAMIESTDPNKDHILCHDVRSLRQVQGIPGWDSQKRGHGYRSFASVPVLKGSEPVGMLTVDTRDAHALTYDEVRLLRVLGRALGAGL